MLIYEKNNKLNINFDNEISENPDLQIGKENGETQVLIDGQQGGGSSGGGAFYVKFLFDESTSAYSADKTFEEIKDAYLSGKVIFAEDTYFGSTLANLCSAYIDDDTQLNNSFLFQVIGYSTDVHDNSKIVRIILRQIEIYGDDSVAVMESFGNLGS